MLIRRQITLASRFLPSTLGHLQGIIMTCCLLATNAMAAGNPGAHQHGHARLQMALENTGIDLIFTSPAHNLVGFEREAKTASERQRLADVRRWLTTTPLVNLATGGCQLVSANVEAGGPSAGHGHHHEHGGHHEHGDAHRDYQVSQRLTCANPIDGEALTSPLLAEFSELQELTIEWVGPTGQGSVVMASPDFTFSAQD